MKLSRVATAVILAFTPFYTLHADQSAARSVHAVDRAYMNLKVSPTEDFYSYANGSFDQVPIPPEYSSYGVNDEINARTNALLRAILVDATQAKAPAGTLLQRVGDFYRSGMDEDQIERDGIEPLHSIFDEIAKIKTHADEQREIAHLQARGFEVAFDLSVSVDDKNSSQVLLRLTQGGVGLPERDYYLRPDADSEKIRQAYQTHIARTFELAGDAAAMAKTEAADVMRLETQMAKAGRTLEELQDPERNYHKIERDALNKVAPQIDWSTFLRGIGFPNTEAAVIVDQPEFIAAIGHLLDQEPIATWQTYLRWQVLRETSAALSRPFVEEHFDFYGRTLSGAKALKPRWERVLGFTDAALGEDLGQLYVAKAFPPAAKARALQMVQFHLQAMHQRIAAADWLSDATKTAAYRKLDRMRVKVGYPDVWRDYSRLIIKHQAFVLNVIAANQFDFQRNLAKLGRPVDHNEWAMTPSTNDAYYEPTLNEMCFPAGILQPPFFDLKADDASNYGALASTMGHELTHGFDNVGRQYDAEGNLKNWWTDEDLKRFQERAETIASLYSKYEVLPGLYINGHQGLTENIADVGGLRISYEAFKLATAGKTFAPVDGFTTDQRFFIAFAQGWRTNQRPEQLRLTVRSDTHSPARWRVLGPVANFPEFRAAFDAPPLTEKGPRIW